MMRCAKALARVGTPARIYVEWLTSTVILSTASFGDAGKADQTLFPRAFGLKAAAPLWTAPAFDAACFSRWGYHWSLSSSYGSGS